MGITKVTRNYQITLPADIRELDRIRIGDELILKKDNGKTVVEKIDRKAVLEKTFGAWKSKGSGLNYVREIREDSEKRLKRLGL